MHPILTVNPDAPDGLALRAAVEAIRCGGVIAYPTETVYGLGADPLNETAIRRVFGLKGRDAEKAVILLLRGESDLSTVASEVSDTARHLMDAFWPGSLTLVLKASPGLPKVLLGGGDTVAVRVSSHPVARALADLLGGPITSTSANRSGHPPARSASDVRSAFGDEIDLIVDGGPSSDDPPSTVVDVSGGRARMVREGRVGRAEVERAMGGTLE